VQSRLAILTQKKIKSKPFSQKTGDFFSTRPEPPQELPVNKNEYSPKICIRVVRHDATNPRGQKACGGNG
jgi:hypothetical protein